MVFAWKVQGNVQETSNVWISGVFWRVIFPGSNFPHPNFQNLAHLLAPAVLHQHLIETSDRMHRAPLILRQQFVHLSMEVLEMTGGCWCQWIGWRENLNRKPWVFTIKLNGASGEKFPVIQFCADDATGCVAVGDADATGCLRFDFLIFFRGFILIILPMDW